MKFELVRQDALSGYKAGIYSVRIEDAPETLLERFLQENHLKYEAEITDILLTIKQMGHATGARETFFKQREGKPGDGVEALYDLPGKSLRLYCIRNGRVAVIVGGGGPKTTRTWQDDPKLSAENRLIQRVSRVLTKALIEEDIYWSPGGTELLGTLTFDTDDYR